MATQDRYKLSSEWLARARKVTPLGAQTRSKAAQVFCEGAYPAVLYDASGPFVWDVDKNCYTDFIMGLGAVGIGYEQGISSGRYPYVLDITPSWSLPTKYEIEYAEALIQALGWPEMVRFVKTGSEATEAAMRIARVATGRDWIISVGYHGWHTVHDAAYTPRRPGIPVQTWRDIGNWPYGTFPDFKEDGLAYDVAAVIIEPVLHEAPPDHYLQTLKEECSRHGAILIFDEVVSGFRWDIAGATSYFGVTPDLACYGKAMANGWPIACVVGKRELMEEGGKYVSGTYGGEVQSIAMAHRTLQRYQEEDIIGDIWTAGKKLQDGFNQAAETLKAPYKLSGYPCKPYIQVTWDDSERKLISLLLQEAAKRGILLHPASLCVSSSHHRRGERVIEKAVDALHLAMLAVMQGAELEGKPSEPVFKRV